MRALLLLFAIIAAPAFGQVGGGPTHSPETSWIAAELKKRAAVWEGLDAALSTLKKPKPYAGIYFAECGTSGEGGSFNTQTRVITVCYEAALQAAKAQGAGGQGAAGYVLWVILHEYGHAAIAAAPVPPLGREEDAADMVAAVIVRKTGKFRQVLQDMLRTDWKPAPGLRENFAWKEDMLGEHSLTAQRRANVICWAGADDRELMQSAINAGLMTNRRADRCAREAEKAERAVIALLQQ